MRRAAIVLSLPLLAACLLAAPDKPPEPAVREIKMTAKKYEFNPEEIRVKQGERVRLLITATDRDHGIEIKELGIKVRLEEGKETPVEFTAEKPGEYEFKCSVRCGWRHGSMKGRLIVEPVGGSAPMPIGGPVSAPQCAYCPQPEYSREARKARLEGIVVLWAVIDEKGRVREARVSRGLGLGLDEEAVLAVKRWSFKAATREGKPVPVYMTIEMHFHLR